MILIMLLQGLVELYLASQLKTKRNEKTDVLIPVSSANFGHIRSNKYIKTSDCNSPIKVGYNLGNPTATTYRGRVSVDSCDTGYSGNPSVTELTCHDTGSWSDVTGCTILGKLTVVDFIL